MEKKHLMIQIERHEWHSERKRTKIHYYNFTSNFSSYTKWKKV